MIYHIGEWGWCSEVTLAHSPRQCWRSGGPNSDGVHQMVMFFETHEWHEVGEEYACSSLEDGYIGLYILLEVGQWKIGEEIRRGENGFGSPWG